MQFVAGMWSAVEKPTAVGQRTFGTYRSPWLNQAATLMHGRLQFPTKLAANQSRGALFHAFWARPAALARAGTDALLTCIRGGGYVM